MQRKCRSNLKFRLSKKNDTNTIGLMQTFGSACESLSIEKKNQKTWILFQTHERGCSVCLFLPNKLEATYLNIGIFLQQFQQPLCTRRNKI